MGKNESKLDYIMIHDENELLEVCKKNEYIRKKIYEEFIYCGYFDETHNYIIECRKDTVVKILKRVFGATEVKLI